VASLVWGAGEGGERVLNNSRPLPLLPTSKNGPYLSFPTPLPDFKPARRVAGHAATRRPKTRIQGRRHALKRDRDAVARKGRRAEAQGAVPGRDDSAVVSRFRLWIGCHLAYPTGGLRLPSTGSLQCSSPPNQEAALHSLHRSLLLQINTVGRKPRREWALSAAKSGNARATRIRPRLDRLGSRSHR
jgi:hypothetical protein